MSASSSDNSPSPFPDMPRAGIVFPKSPITAAAFAYTKKHTTEAVYNHCVRSAYWALIIARKGVLASNRPGGLLLPPAALDLEAVVLACVLHDMGWTFSKDLLTTYRRFEVDGAEIARDFIESYKADGGAGAEDWSVERVQKVWDAIALHTTRSIAAWGSPEVASAYLGIVADFVGPLLPSKSWADPSSAPPQSAPGSVISVEEFKEVARAFPHVGFGKQAMTELFCGFCRDKPLATFENFVGSFGLKYGYDGKGGGKEEYAKLWTEANDPDWLSAGLEYIEGILKEDEEK